MADARFSAQAITAALLVACFTMWAAPAHSGKQDTRTPSLHELAGELRALRTEVKEIGVANLQASLLIARVQLQEARINGVAWQLSDIRNRLHAFDRQKAKPLALIQYEEEIKARGGTLLGHDEQLADARAQLSRVEREEQPIRNQEAQLANQLQIEQQRWTEFVKALDELERALARFRDKR